MSEICSKCGWIHPAPRHENCPVKVKGSENGLETEIREHMNIFTEKILKLSEEEQRKILEIVKRIG